MRMYCNKQQPTISGDMNDLHFSYYFSKKSTKTFFFINDRICIHVQTVDKLNSRNELKILQAFLKKTFNFNSRIASYGFAIFQKITFARYTCKRIRKALDLGFNKKGAKLSSEFFICRLFLTTCNY